MERVQIQVVRHHGGAQDADRDVEHRRVGDDLASAAPARPATVGQGRLRHDELDREADADRGHEGDDERLEVAEALVLQQQDQQHVERGEADAPDQRNPEQQVQRDGRADHLGQVAGGDGDLAEHPEHEAHGARVVVAAGLRQVAPGRDAQLEGERLQQDRHQVGDQDDAQQRVAEPRAAGEVGGPVARVHVADRHHVARARRRRAPCARRRRRAGPGRCGATRAGSAACADSASRRAPRPAGSTAALIARPPTRRARRAPARGRCTCCSPAASTVTGPPNGWRSRTVTTAPGREAERRRDSGAARARARRPGGSRRSRPPATSASGVHGQLMDGAVGRGDRVAVRIDGRMAQRRGHPLDQGVRDGVLQPLGLVVHGVPASSPRNCDQVGLDEPVTAHHPERGAAAGVGELDALVGDVLEQAELREPLDHAAHRGGATARAGGRCRWSRRAGPQG